MKLLKKHRDRSFIKASADRILEVVEQIVKNAISKGHDIKDIQVLAPMYRGPAGIDGLNKMIQANGESTWSKTKRSYIW